MVYFVKNLDWIHLAAIFNLFKTKRMRIEYLITEEKLQPLTREVIATLYSPSIITSDHNIPLYPGVAILYVVPCTVDSQPNAKHYFLKTYKKRDQMTSMIEEKFRDLLLLKLKCWIFFFSLENRRIMQILKKLSREHPEAKMLHMLMSM